jgi:hypothetical protein
MYVVRDVFYAKPGKARELVAKFRAAAPHLAAMGLHDMQVMTDAVGDYWTVVAEAQVESLDHYFDVAKRERDHPQIAQAMAGYMDLITGGRREIFKLE